MRAEMHYIPPHTITLTSLCACSQPRMWHLPQSTKLGHSTSCAGRRREPEPAFLFNGPWAAPKRAAAPDPGVGTMLAPRRIGALAGWVPARVDKECKLAAAFFACGGLCGAVPAVG